MLGLRFLVLIVYEPIFKGFPKTDCHRLKIHFRNIYVLILNKDQMRPDQVRSSCVRKDTGNKNVLPLVRYWISSQAKTGDVRVPKARESGHIRNKLKQLQQVKKVNNYCRALLCIVLVNLQCDSSNQR